MGRCTGTGMVILDRVRSAIGLTFGCGCRALRRSDSLAHCFSTLGVGALGVGTGKAIGNAMVGGDSFGISLRDPKFLEKSNNLCLHTLGSSACGTLLGSCAWIMSLSPLQPCVP